MSTYFILDVGYSDDEEDGMEVGQELRINFEGLKLKTEICSIEVDSVVDEEGCAKSDRFVILKLKKEDLV